MEERFLIFAGIVAAGVVVLALLLGWIDRKGIPGKERVRRGTGNALLGLQEFIEPSVEVGATLCDMPMFLTPEVYIPLPLEATYQSAWEAVPTFWRDVLDAP